jgi:hypothetical protein
LNDSWLGQELPCCGKWRIVVDGDKHAVSIDLFT